MKTEELEVTESECLLEGLDALESAVAKEAMNVMMLDMMFSRDKVKADKDAYMEQFNSKLDTKKRLVQNKVAVVRAKLIIAKARLEARELECKPS